VQCEWREEEEVLHLLLLVVLEVLLRVEKGIRPRGERRRT
jgi:hypothetical protein